MSLHQLKKIAATLVATALPLGTVYRLAKKRYIFCYHRVVPYEYAQKFNMHPAMWISPDTFSDDIRWMKKHGNIVGLDTILDPASVHGKPLFSITFDDGWIDNYKYAFPILKEHAVTATVFLVTNAINTGEIFWVEDFLYKIARIQDKHSVLDAKNKLLSICIREGVLCSDSGVGLNEMAGCYAEYLKTRKGRERAKLLSELYEYLSIDAEPIVGEILTWKQIQEMRDFGIMFGSHTHTHEILKYEDDDLIYKELCASKRILEDNLQEPVHAFCYPNARYRLDNTSLLSKAGYKYGFILENEVCTKRSSDYLIPRYLLCERMSTNKNYLICKLLKLPLF